MSSSPEELFRHAAGKVFNTWTALQLAVEHGMGGAQGYSKAMCMIDGIVQLFKNKPSAEWEEVADLLADMMDDEFNTICEDDSTDEVGLLLWEFYRHCVSGDKELVESEIAKLPAAADWLSKCMQRSSGQNTNSQNNDDDDDDDEDSDGESAHPNTANGQHQLDSSMDTQEVDADPGWTQVNRRKK